MEPCVAKMRANNEKRDAILLKNGGEIASSDVVKFC